MSSLLGGALYGYQMDGYFGGCDGKTISEILLDSNDWVESEEMVDGVACNCVAGETQYGKIKVCLDPAQGFTIRYGRVEENKESISEVSVTRVEKVGDWYIPVTGVYTSTFKGNVVATSLQRTEIVLMPDFDGTDAFQMDFDEGARITDVDGKERIFYIWTNGQMVPEGASGINGVAGDARTYGGAKRRLTWVFVLINAILLGILIIFRLRRKGSARN